MRLLIEATWWLKGPPSGRHVLQSIVEAWSRNHPADQITVAVPRGVDASDSRWLVAQTRLRQQAVVATLEAGRIPGHDAVLTHNFTALRSPALRCTYVYDALSVAHPEWFGWKERAYLAPILPLARRADLVFTAARSEARRIEHHLGGGLDVIATGLGLPAEFRDAAAQRPLVPGLAEQGFILSVGRLNVRKNIEPYAVALAAAGILSPRFPLLVVGAPDGKQVVLPRFQELIADGRVVMLGRVSASELKWLYSACSLYAFPSLDEGFGIPVIEAASLGVPVALSDIPPFREFGEVGEFFDPSSGASMARGTEKAMQDRRPARVDEAAYTWEGVVSVMRNAMMDALR